jgi:hypothetical protein
MRRLFVAAAVLALCPASAHAATAVVNFDSTPVGTALGTVSTAVGNVTFAGGPTVFAPPAGTTTSPPNALHTPLPCLAAPTTCYQQEFDFASPMTSVALRLGNEDEMLGEFPAPYQLTGYDAGGHVVASSNPQALLGAEGYNPITTYVSITSAHTDIARAVISVGVTDDFVYNASYASRVNIDDLTLANDAPPPLPPPAITISSPTPGQSFTQPSDVGVSGSISAPAGLNRFCLTTSTAATIPDDCNQRFSVTPAATFVNVPVSGLVPGQPNTITAWVKDAQERVASTSVTIDMATVNLAATNLEVNQDVQSALAPVTAPSGGPRTAAYSGVPLAAGRATVVRFWADVQTGTGPQPLRGVRAQLIGTRGGVSLGAPLTPVEGSRTLSGADAVLTGGPTDFQRSQPGSQAFTFTLPASWASGTITLQAVINPPGSVPAILECATCAADNSITLSGVTFRTVRGEHIVPIEMVTREASGVVDHPNPVYGDTETIYPFPITLGPYAGQIDISDGIGVPAGDHQRQQRQDLAMGKLLSWVDHNGNPDGHVVAISDGQDLGLTMTALVCCDTHLGIDTVAQTADTRPLTSVAHEFGHEVGLSHAGYNCPQNPAGSGGATHWPPPDMGDLNGFGIDPRTGSGGSAGPFRILGPLDAAGNSQQNFDVMSYCANEGNAWISVTNWTDLLNNHATGGRRSALRVALPGGGAAGPGAVIGGQLATVASAGPALKVQAIIPGNGPAQMLDVEPLTGRTMKPAPASPVTIKVFDAAGDVTSSTKVPVTLGHMDGNGAFLLVDGVVRAPHGAQVAVAYNGKTLVRRTKPRHRPRVTVLAPKRQSRLGGKGTTLVRWKVRDPDHVKLSAAIQYSTDGRHWRTLVTGARGTSYRLGLELLTKSSRGRLRVRVSDGWNVGQGTATGLRVAGPASRASIDQPLAGARIAADGTVVVHGSGVDDRGRAITGHGLRWYEGGRYLGSGATLAARGWVPGDRHLRLVTVADGRVGGVSVPVTVVRKSPAFSLLAVTRRGSMADVRIAATAPGVVSIGSRRSWLGARMRRFTVPAHGKLRIVLRTPTGTIAVDR